MKKLKYYRVTNTTIRPIEKDKNGNDTRTTAQKTGHIIKFNDPDKGTIYLHAGKDVIVNHKTVDLDMLKKNNIISVEEIKDVVENVFKKYDSPSANTRTRVTTEGSTKKVTISGSNEVALKKRVVKNERSSDKKKR